MDWQKLWNDITTFFSNNWLNMIWFVLALVLGIILIKIICGLLSKGLAKKMDRIVSNFIVVIVKFCLCMVLVFVLAGIMNINTTGLVAVISAAGLTLSLSLQDSLSNVASGMLIVSQKPFKEKDYVEIDGVGGQITRIGVFTTELVTFDNRKITLPNRSVTASPIVNYDAMPTRRVDIKFKASLSCEIDKRGPENPKGQLHHCGGQSRRRRRLCHQVLGRYGGLLGQPFSQQRKNIQDASKAGRRAKRVGGASFGGQAFRKERRGQDGVLNTNSQKNPELTMKIRFKKNSMTWVHLGVGIALLALIVPLAIIYLPSPQNYVVCAFAFVALVAEEIYRYVKTGIYKDVVVTESYVEERGLFKSRRIDFRDVGTIGEISSVYTNSSRAQYFVTTDVYKKKIESAAELDKTTSIVFDASAKSVRAFEELIRCGVKKEPELTD